MVIKKRFRDVLISLTPIIFLVTLFELIKPSKGNNYFYFLGAAVFILVGIWLFMLGVNNTITDMASDFSYTLTKQGKRRLILGTIFFVSMIVIVFEPMLVMIVNDLFYLSKATINRYYLSLAVLAGSSLYSILGVIKIVYRLRAKLLIYYLLIINLVLLLVISFRSPHYFTFSFDVGASAIGMVSVPFLLSFAIGLSKNIKATKESQYFGFVGIVFMGAVLGALLYFIIIGDSANALLVGVGGLKLDEVGFMPTTVLSALGEAGLSIGPLFILYLYLYAVFFRYHKWHFLRVLMGFIYLFLGLFSYYLGLKVGFVAHARWLGMQIAQTNIGIILLFSFILGITITLSEPAVMVFVEKISEVTSGTIKKKVIILLTSLSIGLSMLLMALTIYYPQVIQMEYLFLTLYLMALFLALRTKTFFTAISFDSGPIATGIMVISFLLPYLQGLAFPEERLVPLATIFGTLSIMVIIPTIIFELFGIFYHYKLCQTKKKRGIV